MGDLAPTTSITRGCGSFTLKKFSTRMSSRDPTKKRKHQTTLTQFATTSSASSASASSASSVASKRLSEASEVADHGQRQSKKPMTENMLSSSKPSSSSSSSSKPLVSIDLTSSPEKPPLGSRPFTTNTTAGGASKGTSLFSGASAAAGSGTGEMKAQSGQRVISNAGFKFKTADGQSKKIVIKGFKVKPKVPDNFEEEIWDKLKRAVDSIHTSKAVPDSLEELYKVLLRKLAVFRSVPTLTLFHARFPLPSSLAPFQACETLCIYKKGEFLYTRLRKVCEDHVKAESDRLQSLEIETASMLKVVNDMWQDYCNQMIMIRSIFLYLDRTYVMQACSEKSLWEMGLILFREHVMSIPETRKKTVDGMLEAIEKERNGDQISRDLLRSLLTMLSDLSIYITSFETVFLEKTEQFYREEGKQMIASLSTVASGSSVAKYLEHSSNRLEQERELCTPGVGYLNSGTRKSLIAVIERELVKNHVATLLERGNQSGTGFDDLIHENRVEDLHRMYTLFDRCSALNELRTSFGNYIVVRLASFDLASTGTCLTFISKQKSGTVIVNDPARDAQMVEELLNFKKRMDDLLQNSFAKNEAFANTLKESFESFINKRPNKPAEMIAKHVDAVLKTSKGISESEMESVLDRCLVLFRFIHGKDVFEAFYKKDLAKRLLLGRSASVDSEKSMLAKLKAECGGGFTSKLEGMFRDMDTSKDIMVTLRQSQRAMQQLSSIDLNVNVLTAGFWPTYAPAPATLPAELSEPLEVFKGFYVSKHSGRRLTWQNQLGTCIVKSKFKKGTKELSVSLFQTVVLLLFNTNTKLSYKDILSQTSIDPGELERTLQSLACGKVRVLNKHPKGRDINSTDDFEVNESFENPLYRIKINSIQMKETVEENKDTTERVFADRQYQVDAAIVRIMKTRKRLSHTALIAELFDQLKFPLKAPDLKKRIESLIDREYLERDKDDTTWYTYLA
ncbi:Cullin-4A [Chytridiales sp. JEL 0842]|nr:Cullin-4A [Chytridiales sp. JEL 0842]